MHPTQRTVHKSDGVLEERDKKVYVRRNKHPVQENATSPQAYSTGLWCYSAIILDNYKQWDMKDLEGNGRRLLEINFVGIYMKDLGNPENISDSRNSGRIEIKERNQ